MITTKDFRRGNLVLHDGQIVEIAMIMVNHVNVSGAMDVPIEKIEPIQLTREWMERYGFQKTFEPGEWNDFNLEFDSGCIIPHSCIKWDADEKKFKLISADGLDLVIDFVHELQNLYYVHNKKELEYKG